MENELNSMEKTFCRILTGNHLNDTVEMYDLDTRVLPVLYNIGDSGIVRFVGRLTRVENERSIKEKKS